VALVAHRRSADRWLALLEQWQGSKNVELEVIAIILLGGAAVGGIAYLLQEYRSRRDFDWT
jgi:hypothetical protein